MPLVVLTPNVFVIPDLSYPGLATQELVFALVVVTLLGLALVDARRGLATPASPDVPVLLTLGGLILWPTISLAWAPDPAEGWRVTGIWLGLAILLALGLARPGEAAGRRLLLALTIVTVVLAGLQLFEYLRFGGQVFGLLFNHGIAAEALALLLPVHAVAALSERRPRAAAAAFLATGLGAAALVATLRRGPLAGVLLGTLALGAALLLRRQPAPRPWRLAGLATLVVLVAAPLAIRERATIAVRIEGATHLDAEELGLRSRAKTWAVAWELARLHPLWGLGAGGYAARYAEGSRLVAEHPRYAAIVQAADPEDGDEVRSPLAHSEYLQVLAELGWVGLGLFAAVGILVARRLLTAAGEGRPLAMGALAGLLAFAVSSGVSAFSIRFTPGVVLVGAVVALGLAGSRPVATAGQARAPAGRRIRLRIRVLLITLLVVAAGLSAWRAHRVFLGQRAQSRLDLRLGRDAATNEALLGRYHEVLSLDPWNAGARLGLALLRYQVGPVAEAVLPAAYAYRHGYGRPFGCLLLAFVHEGAGDLDRAVALTGRCAAAFPRSVVTRAAHAALLRRRGETEAADHHQALAATRDPVRAASWALALRLRREAATAEAAASGLVPPDRLTPKLLRGLVQARAHRHLR